MAEQEPMLSPIKKSDVGSVQRALDIIRDVEEAERRAVLTSELDIQPIEEQASAERGQEASFAMTFSESAIMGEKTVSTGKFVNS